jgi:type II secretory pathway component PulK
MRQAKSNQGMAFVYVLLILVVGTVLVTGLLAVSQSENSQSINQGKNIKAYYIARAGADVMVHRLLTIDRDYWDDFATTHTTNDTPFGGGSFKVSVSRTGDDYEVTSAGTYQNESQEVKAVLQYNPYTRMD